MNHLLNAAAIAAGLAIAAPALAQAPTTTNPAATPSATAPSYTQSPYTQSAPSSAPQAAPYAQQAPTQSTTQAAPYAQQAPTQPAPSATATAPYSASEAASEPTPRHVLRRAHRRGYVERTRRTHRTHTASTGTRSRGMSDNIADQLNRQELSRSSGGTTAPAGYAPSNTMQSYGSSYGQPSPTEGMPGTGQPSASSRPAGQMR